MTTPAADKRERILERLPLLLKDIPGIRTCVRNEINLPDTEFPAIIILDADEARDDSSDGRGRPANAPQRMYMTPEIYILVNEKPDTVGPVLSAFRRDIIKAVLNDATLVAACTHGEVRYEGFATSLAAGRSMAGEAGVSFTFVYMLQPQTL